MGTFTKGDIVIFPFPYTDLTSTKIRPCLVMSEEMGEDIILCQITSSTDNKYSIELKTNETVNGTLSINSFIRTNMLFTASKSQISKKICKLKKEKYSKVVSKIINTIS